jgi:hypothetical protein
MRLEFNHTAHRELILLLVRDHLIGIIKAQGGDPRFNVATADIWPPTQTEKTGRDKWQGFERAVALTAGLARLALHRQTLEKGFDSPISWSTALTASPTLQQAITNGIALALAMCAKTRKGRAEDIIIKNMTTTEPHVLAHHVMQLPIWPKLVDRMSNNISVDEIAKFLIHEGYNGGAVYRMLELLPTEGSVVPLEKRKQMLESLLLVTVAQRELLPRLEKHFNEQCELFHACALAAARAEQARVPFGVVPGQHVVLVTKFLRLLLSSHDNHLTVRNWIFKYTVRNMADNGYKVS